MNFLHNSPRSFKMHPIYFLLAIAIFLSNCTHTSEFTIATPTAPPLNSPAMATLQPSMSSWERAKLYGPQDLSPSGIEFASPPERNLVGFHTFEVQPNVVITTSYHYLNRSSETTNLRLFILLNEQQIQGGIGNDSTAFYTDVSITPNTEITLPVTLPPLTDGIYNCMLISIINPDNPVGLNSSRATLLAGNYNEATSNTYVPMQDMDFPLEKVGLFVTNELGLITLAQEWENAQVSPGTMLEYAIYAGYQSPTSNSDIPHNIAILTFLDHIQVATQVNGPMVFYGQLLPRTVGKYLFNVQMPLQPGEHNLMILLVENPQVVLNKVVRGPDSSGTGAVSQVLWDVLAHDVSIQVQE